MSTLKVTNINAADGTSALSIADGTGKVSLATNSNLELQGTGKVFAPNGIVFSSTELTTDDASTTTRTESSNLLDDYEEGTWTPVVGGTGGTPSYTVQTASYVKIGAQVYCEAYVDLTVSPSGSASIFISGLPFTSNPSSNRYRSGSIFPVKGFGGSWDMICLDLAASSTAINLYKSSVSTGNNFASFTASDLGGTLNFRIAISYTV